MDWRLITQESPGFRHGECQGDGVEIMETRKVFKSGNSLVVSLPKEVIDTLAIREGQPLGFEIIIGGVTIKPLCNSRPKGIIKKIAGCLKDEEAPLVTHNISDFLKIAQFEALSIIDPAEKV